MDIFLANRLSILTKFASKWKAVGRWPLLYWSAGLQSTTKNLTPSFWITHEVKKKECVKSEGWADEQDTPKQFISVQMNWHENDNNILSDLTNEWMIEWVRKRVNEWASEWMNEHMAAYPL